MSITVSWVRPARKSKPAEPAKLPAPIRVWPFPSSDPAERDRMAREHQRQQREAIVNGPEALL